MYLPKYNLTQTISNNLSEIERLYGRLEGMKIPKQLLLNLERTNLIQSVFSSNSIEGNPLTHPVVTNIILNDRVPVNRDEKEVVNYFGILKNLEHKAVNTLTINEVLKIHYELLDGINEKIKGKVREKQIIVGTKLTDSQIIIKHNPPFHDKTKIEQALVKLIDWTNNSPISPILKAGVFHHEFVYLHPFEDGNGRTCRLTTALILLKNHYLINKYFVLDDYYDIDRTNYSDTLHTADSGDKTLWLEYFTSGVKYSLQSSLGKIESGLNNLTIDLRPTTKEQNVLKIVQETPQITSKDISTKLKISRQQAFNLLKSLVNKGFLEKKGGTKNSYYFLKSTP